MKQFIALLLAVLMCLTVLVSCNKTNGNETTPQSTPSASSPEEPASSPEAPASSPEEPASSPEAPESSSEPGVVETVPPTGSTESTPAESKPSEPTVEYDLEAAAAYVNSLYKKADTVTAVDYQVVGQVMIAGIKYMVAWSADNDLVKTVEGSPYWTIDVDEKAKEEHTYKLTATITAGDGTTTSVSFDRVVPKYNLTSFEDYMAAAEGDTVVIEGIVVAMNGKSVGNSRNHLFLADVEGKGGYYCYQLDDDPVAAGVKIGMTVSVTAKVKPYSGMQETSGGTFAIVDETIKTVEPLDITDKYTAGESLKNYVGLPVVIKGVTLGSQDLTGSSQYLYFEANGVKAYVRSYITDFPTTLTIVKGENGAISSPDKTAIDEDHAAHFGYTADVTGILILYSGNPYLIPMSTTPFTNYKLNEKTPAEKLEAELGDLKIDASFNSDKVIDLLATGKYYSDVTLAWATTDTSGAAVIADGKLTLKVPDKETVVTVTVTATCGTETATKTFSIKLSKTITSITDALAIGSAKDHNTYTEEKYLVAGIIKEVYNATYGNMYIVDEYGNEFTVYGTYSADGATRYDKLENKPQAGDYIVVLGTLGQYNGTAQMKNGWIQSYTTKTSIGGVLDAVKDFEKNQYTDDKYVISGVITEVQNTTYGNIVIKDADGNSILVYGLYSANGATRYDKMETKPVVGDTITVLGIVGKYNDAQMKNGWLIGYTAGTTTEPDVPAEPEEPDVPAEPTLDAVAPVVGTAYKFAFYQGNVKKTFYLTGVLSGYYMASTEDVANAVNYYVEAAEGGFYLYCMVDGAKVYVNMVVSGTYVNAKYETAATTVYTYNETLKTLVAKANGADYIFGTKNDGTFTTLGPMKADSGCFHAVFVASTTTDEPVAPPVVEPEEPAKTEDGRYAYTLNAGKDALNVDGVKDEAYANGLSWEAKYNTPASYPDDNATKKLFANPEKNTFTVYMAADANYVYVLYVVQDEFVVGQAKASAWYRGDCADFILGPNNEASLNNDMRIFGDKEGGMGVADVKGQYAAVKDLYVKTTEVGYNVEFKIDRTAFANANVFSFLAMGGACAVETTSATVYPCIENGAGEGGNPAKAKLNQVTIVDVAVEEPEDKTMSVAEALKAADGTTVIVTGTVASIVTEWSDQFNNITINLKGEDGSLLYIYRMGTKVNVGDVITVTGVMDTYSNSRQIAQGATAVIVKAHTCTTFADATCTDPKTCTECGKTEGAALGHGTPNAEGKCPVCGEVPAIESELAIAANKGTLSGKTITWQGKGFTVVGDQAKSTSAIRTSDSDHYRVYKSSTLAVKGTGITKVVITAQNADYAKVLAQSLTTAGVTATVDGTVVTLTVTSGTVNEILLTATAQFRITKVVVTYIA